MGVEPTDKTRTLIACRRAAREFTALLREVTAPDRNAIGYWSIGDVAAHVSHIFALYPGLARGEGAPVADHLKLSEHWNRRLVEDPEREPTALAERIDASLAEFIESTEAATWDADITWYGGVSLPVWVLPTILINECDIHGLDVARAEERSWSIPAPDARLVINGLMPLLEAFVNKEATAGIHTTYGLHVRGDRTFYITIDDGVATTDSTKKKADCHISVDPVDYLLIGYGRKQQWGPLLTGKIVTWGRKPWLSLRLPTLFHSV